MFTYEGKEGLAVVFGRSLKVRGHSATIEASKTCVHIQVQNHHNIILV